MIRLIIPIPAVVFIMGIIFIIFHKQIGGFLYKLGKDTEFIFDDMKTLEKFFFSFQARTVKGISKNVLWVGIGFIVSSIILYFWVLLNAL